MKKEFIIKRCSECGATVKVLKDCNCGGCGIICCNQKMQTLIPNQQDAAAEKHVPTYEKKDHKIIVRVNHVMEENHYIEWISMVSNEKETTVYLKPSEKAEVEFDYVDGSTLYAYCNLHGLWKKDIEE